MFYYSKSRDPRGFIMRKDSKPITARPLWIHRSVRRQIYISLARFVVPEIRVVLFETRVLARWISVILLPIYPTIEESEAHWCGSFLA